MSERDWTEDFSHENGMYENICHVCHLSFCGHKRRVVCKKCFSSKLSNPVGKVDPVGAENSCMMLHQNGSRIINAKD